MQFPRNVGLGLLALGIIGVAIYFASTGISAEQARLPSTARVFGQCLACKQILEVEHRATDVAPFPCQVCGRVAVYDLLYCRQCRKRFVPALAKSVAADPPRLPATPLCTACGSADACAYDPRSPRQQPSGDAPPPPWSGGE